jgi:predicted O-methyltransferase YrrM
MPAQCGMSGPADSNLAQVHADDGRTARWESPETWVDEDDALQEARAIADDLGCEAVPAATGVALRFLAAALRARSVVEVGTGTGVSGLWLLRGMTRDGVLTSIDPELEHQRSARAAFRAGGFAPARVRLINGRALDVLPRLADGAYDLVFLDGLLEEYPRYLGEAVRLLRPGGVVAMTSVLLAEQSGEQDTPEGRALSEVLRAGRDDDRLVSLLLPIGEGLLLSAKAG